MIALRVDNISKSYRIAHQASSGAGRYRTLREDLTDIPKRLLARFGSSSTANSSGSTSEEFHALRDINFEVQQGEVLGVIGRNGAGKSTLLKILSRITEPTSGRVEVFGRVASLLEVGTGFHPELTGRENIFLNGAILGMRRAEIARKFDEIVDFAEVEKFLDTPVKRYSSGMYVRLAFAVAAHLDPEILIVDEVLAVGDGEFQKKCLGKMQEVSQSQGRTVFFVSHNMAAIHQLCTHALLLDKGSLVTAGSPLDVIDTYLHTAAEAGFTGGKRYEDSIWLTDAQTLDSSGKVTNRFTHRESIRVRMDCVVAKPVAGANIGIVVKDGKDRVVFRSEKDFPALPASSNGAPLTAICEATIPGDLLVPGRYVLILFIHVPVVRMLFLAEDALVINIIDAGSAAAVYEGKADYGCVFVDCRWQIDFSGR